MILSEQTFIELAGKQEVLDAKIKAAKGITELPLERIELAYRVEAAECVNEMKGDMKYWSDKPMNREAFLEEFVDALHFMLSWANHSYGTSYSSGIETVEETYDCIAINLEHIKMSEFSKELSWHWGRMALTAENGLEESFAYLLLLVELYGYSEQDIIDTYNRKNAVNHDRSDSGVY